jgi:hypothetical protein
MGRRIRPALSRAFSGWTTPHCQNRRVLTNNKGYHTPLSSPVSRRLTNAAVARKGNRLRRIIA